MKVAVMGAGAVGCYFGALLARSGHAVTLIGRPVHVEAMNRDGLLLEMRNTREHVRVRGATDPSAAAEADMVMVCVKSADTENAGRALAPHLKPDAVVLSLQNGVDNADRLAATIVRPVIPAVVYVGTEMAGPGHVRHHGRGELILGKSEPSAAIAKLLTDAAIPTSVSDDVAQVLWLKLMYNCAFNALSAVSQLPYGALMEVAETRAVVVALVEECVAVARASGVAVADDTLDRVLGLPTSMPAQMSSTAQDLARGKPTEIDHLNGFVVRKGREVGVPAPTNLAMQVMVQLQELRQSRSA